MIQTLIGVAIATIYVLVTFLYEKREKSNVYKILSYLFMALLVETIGVFLQMTFGNTLGLPLVAYEYLIYIGKAFAPTLAVVFALVYENPKVDIKKYAWIFFIPVYIIVAVWTNEWHGMFFENYTSVVGGNTYGVLYYSYIALVYLQAIPAMLLIIRSSMDKSKFLSPQTLLLMLTCVIPFIPRIVALVADVDMPEYVLPISYMAMSLILSLNILKYNVLNAVPIALNSVIDLMSDAFVVISHDGDIVDKNRSFDSKFEKIMNLKVNKNIFDVVKYEGIKALKKLKTHIMEAEDKGRIIVEEYHIVKQKYDRYFEVQIQPIRARTTNGYIATLLVFKDITEQKGNMDIYAKSESLEVIGELAGGVAHDINTPITAIKSGLIMLSSTVQTDMERQLIENMTNSADKISNLVNSLKNQTRNLGSNSDTEFNLKELIQDLYVLMHSELTKHNVRLDIRAEADIWITGNTSKLVQVLSNIIQNAIEAYGEKGGIIDIDIYRDDVNRPVIKIEDWAGGIKEEIRPMIFKKIIRVNEMPTAGVGLYLANSVIRGSFGGKITFDTKTGRGTRFYITLPNN
ncbi:MAG: hypothetical protein IJ272_08400 [Clostridia bacterium]|nr:hypothetical protein [Clostridia bacterium]